MGSHWITVLVMVVLCHGAVDDRAHLLRADTVGQAEAVISRIRRVFGYDVVVLTQPADRVNSTNARLVARNYAGDRMSGVIFVMTSRGLWMFNSRSLDPIFSNAVKQRIWQDMTKMMKEGDVDNGLLLGLSEVQREMAPLAARPRGKQDPVDFSFFWTLLVSGALLFLICRCASSRFGRQGPVYGVPLSGCNNPPYNPAYNPGMGGYGGGGGGWMSSMFGALGGVFLGNMLYDSVFHRPHYGGSLDGGRDYDDGYHNDSYRMGDQMDYHHGVGGDFMGGDVGGGDFGGGDFGGGDF